MITNCNLQKHIAANKCQNYIRRQNAYKLDHDDLVCKFCGKECKNTNSLIQHEIRCSKNPNRKNYSVVGFNNCGKQAWNKGLTAETDERVARNSLRVK